MDISIIICPYVLATYICVCTIPLGEGKCVRTAFYRIAVIFYYCRKISFCFSSSMSFLHFYCTFVKYLLFSFTLDCFLQ